jgi:hypothetical protein
MKFFPFSLRKFNFGCQLDSLGCVSATSGLDTEWFYKRYISVHTPNDMTLLDRPAKRRKSKVFVPKIVCVPVHFVFSKTAPLSEMSTATIQTVWRGASFFFFKRIRCAASDNRLTHIVHTYFSKKYRQHQTMLQKKKSRRKQKSQSDE